MRTLLPLAVAMALAAPGQGAEPTFYGTWRITRAQLAPWVSKGAATSTPETRRLIGSTVVYRKTRIEGPSPLGCDKPNYELKDAPRDELFQGGLTDPAVQAPALGYRSQTVPTLETGCAGWIDFHFIDDRTALFALNDFVYTLRKQRP